MSWMSRPVARATAASVGAMVRAASSAASKPSVRAAISFSSMMRRSTSATSRPDQRMPSVPGLIEQLQVGAFAGGGAARVDVDDAHAALGARGLDALVEDGVAPGGVGAGQHHEIGQLQVLVALRHHVGAEGAAVAGHRRGHAQARVGVDVRRADEALGQLVGDVIVLGQELAREIEGDRLRAVLGPDGGEPGGHMIERLRPSSCAGHRRSGAAAASPAPASRPAPSPWSTAARSWPDAPDRPRWPLRPCRPASPARRSRRRSRGRWCGRPTSGRARVPLPLAGRG